MKASQLLIKLSLLSSLLLALPSFAQEQSVEKSYSETAYEYTGYCTAAASEWLAWGHDGIQNCHEQASAYFSSAIEKCGFVFEQVPGVISFAKEKYNSAHNVAKMFVSTELEEKTSGLASHAFVVIPSVAMLHTGYSFLAVMLKPVVLVAHAGYVIVKIPFASLAAFKAFFLGLGIGATTVAYQYYSTNSTQCPVPTNSAN